MTYATPLFELAVEENSVESYASDFKLIQEIVVDDQEVFSFFTHFNIDKDVKKATLDEAFKENVSIYILNFLKLLVDKNRMHSLPEIAEAFHELMNQYLGIEEGIVYATMPLDESEISRLEEVLSKRMNKTVHLTLQIDSSLIGGIKVVINDHVIDGTIKNKMTLLKQELLRK